MTQASTRAPLVTRYSEADVPTEYGLLRVVVYRELGTEGEHVAVVGRR